MKQLHTYHVVIGLEHAVAKHTTTVVCDLDVAGVRTHCCDDGADSPALKQSVLALCVEAELMKQPAARDR